MNTIGIDLGGTNIAIGIVDQAGKLLAKKSVKTLSEQGFETMVRRMAETVRSLLNENGMSEKDIAGVGIGSPGTINSAAGTVICSFNLSLYNVPLVAELKKYFSVPVYISNDANCAALGESVSGGAKGLSDVVMITLGTGVGGGVIIGGKIFEGYQGLGTELGHMIIKMGGRECPCGMRGCWEAYASATALAVQTKEAIARHPDSIMAKVTEINGRTAFEAAKKGDRAGKLVVKHYLEYIAFGIVDIVNIFRPQVVLIGGGISHEGAYILKPIQRCVDKYSFGAALTPPPPVRLATLGNDAGIIGAAMICSGKA